jgi:hypothetical protein
MLEPSSKKHRSGIPRASRQDQPNPRVRAASRRTQDCSFYSENRWLRDERLELTRSRPTWCSHHCWPSRYLASASAQTPAAKRLSLHKSNARKEERIQTQIQIQKGSDEKHSLAPLGVLRIRLLRTMDIAPLPSSANGTRAFSLHAIMSFQREGTKGRPSRSITHTTSSPTASVCARRARAGTLQAEWGHPCPKLATTAGTATARHGCCICARRNCCCGARHSCCCCGARHATIARRFGARAAPCPRAIAGARAAPAVM